jgi:FKBP-type peptidyl-prolyl cis-trans isomerase FkpA
MYLLVRRFLPFLFLSVMISFSGCAGTPEFLETASGLKYKFHIKNTENQQVQLYDVVEVFLNYRSKDSLLYPGREKIPFQIIPIYEGDLMEGILMMHLNDSATFILDTKDFFFQMMQFNDIPEHAAGIDQLFFDVKIVNIIPETPELKARRLDLKERRETEAAKIAGYLEDHDIDVDPTPNGLYIVSLVEGSGPKAEKEMEVKVHFKSYFLNDTPYLSSVEKGIPVVFKVGEGKVIPAMEEAVLNMSAGGKAKVIIPSSQAYGAKQRDEVKPYTPLIFEIELLEIK